MVRVTATAGRGPVALHVVPQDVAPVREPENDLVLKVLLEGASTGGVLSAVLNAPAFQDRDHDYLDGRTQPASSPEHLGSG